MTELTKKLIGFDEDLLNKVQKYSEKKKITFTDGVRSLIEMGLASLDQDIPEINVPFLNGNEGVPDMNEPKNTELSSLNEKLEKLKEEMSFWNADEAESKIGNLQVQVNEMEKKLNTVVAIAKKLKGHTENREIHLQD
jgi:hypothetical protein